MKFNIGDKVKFAYISDCNPHNGKVGTIKTLREYNYYPNGDYSVIEKRTQAIIEYDDGKTEGVGDVNRKGCGVVSPLEKVYTEELNRTIEEVNEHIQWLIEQNKTEEICYIELVKDFDNLYYANVIWNGKEIYSPEYIPFRELRKWFADSPIAPAIPELKHWIFKRCGRKQYAYCQGMMTAKSCMVEQ